MDLSLKAGLIIERSHSASAGAEVGMVVCSEENVDHTVVFRGYAKKSAHIFSFVLLRFKNGLCEEKFGKGHGVDIFSVFVNTHIA